MANIRRVSSQPSAKGPEDWFTGTVRMDLPFQADPPARVGGATVTFEPSARTAWHTHPLGQTLFVTAGLGWMQSEGGSIEEIRRGDIVWFEPGERHWHGATPTTSVTHMPSPSDWMARASIGWRRSLTRSTAPLNARYG